MAMFVNNILEQLFAMMQYGSGKNGEEMAEILQF